MAYRENDIVQVYYDPSTRERPAFKARIIKIVNADLGSYDGLELGSYLVQPLGPGQEPCEMVVADTVSGW